MKYIKIFRTLAVALTLALLVTTLPATLTLAQAYLRLSPDEGEIGDNIEVHGAEFELGTIFRLYFSDERAYVGDRIGVDVINYETLGNDTAPAGYFEGFQFYVPNRLRDGDDVDDVRGGTYYVYAAD